MVVMQHYNHMSITILPRCKMYLAVLPENKDVPFLTVRITQISSGQSIVLSFPKAKSGLPPVVEVREELTDWFIMCRRPPAPARGGTSVI